MAIELQIPMRQKSLDIFIFVQNVDHILGKTLVDIEKMAKKNSGYRYTLMIIKDVSKKEWAVPLNHKSGPEI